VEEICHEGNLPRSKSSRQEIFQVKGNLPRRQAIFPKEEICLFLEGRQVEKFLVDPCMLNK